MRTFPNIPNNVSRIKTLEESISFFLRETKSQQSERFLTIDVFPNVYNLLINFYYPCISITSCYSICKGYRILFREMSVKSLKVTGRECFRFVKDVSIQAGFDGSEDFYSLVLSVLPVSQE